MSTATSAVAVVATSAARIDRRALSEAWYSALHLAEHAPPASAAPRRTNAAAPLAHAAGSRAPDAAHTAAAAPPPGVRRGAAEAANAVAHNVDERRAPRTPLARRIERAVARGFADCCGTTSTAFETDGGRVHVVVRTQSGVTRIVALCPPALQPRVERALAHARFALGACGMRAGGA